MEAGWCLIVWVIIRTQIAGSAVPEKNSSNNDRTPSACCVLDSVAGGLHAEVKFIFTARIEVDTITDSFFFFIRNLRQIDVE